MVQSIGEWMNAYQRVTHYFRALEIWHPPPHLLALAVLERALSKAGGDHGLPPLRLAMEELHALLGQHMPVPSAAAGAAADLRGSVCWRICLAFADGAGRLSPSGALPDANEIYRVRPVPEEAPGAMVPQALEPSAFTRTARTITAGIRLRLENAWLRRDA